MLHIATSGDLRNTLGTLLQLLVKYFTGDSEHKKNALLILALFLNCVSQLGCKELTVVRSHFPHSLAFLLLLSVPVNTFSLSNNCFKFINSPHLLIRVSADFYDRFNSHTFLGHEFSGPPEIFTGLSSSRLCTDYNHLLTVNRQFSVQNINLNSILYCNFPPPSPSTFNAHYI